MGRICLTAASEIDYEQIYLYIAEHNPRAAENLLRTFDKKLRLLSGMPGIGRARAEFGAAVRSYPIGHYLLFYRPIVGGIELLACCTALAICAELLAKFEWISIKRPILTIQLPLNADVSYIRSAAAPVGRRAWLRFIGRFIGPGGDMFMGRVLCGLVLSFSFLAWASAEEKRPATVDFRKLKELLPEKLSTLKRTEAAGEKTKLGEFSLSMAHGSYADDAEKNDAPHIQIQIIDYGGAEGMAEGLAAWAKLEIDRETDNGYEKTTKISGQPAFETWDKESQSGHLQIFVGSRFIVTVETSHMAADQLKRIGEALPLKKLSEMK